MARNISLNESIDQVPIAADRSPPVWIIGSGMTRPVEFERKSFGGVPGTQELCRILISETGVDSEFFREKFLRATDNESLVTLYNEVCQTLRLTDSLEPAIQRAVLRATTPTSSSNIFPSIKLNESELERIVGFPGNVPEFIQDNVVFSWNLRPGIESLIRFISAHPSSADHAIITTNFDPLISVAFNRHNVPHVRFSIDGNHGIGHVVAPIPIVYHVHGYWARGSLLNLQKEINPEGRRQLATSLSNLLRDRRIYVLGYSGWDDVVMDALKIVLGASAKVDWLCYSTGSDFTDDCTRLSESLGSPGDALRFVEGANADSYIQTLLQRRLLVPDSQATLKNVIGSLKSEKRDLEAQVDNLRSTLRNISTLESKLDRVIGDLDRTKGSLDSFSTKTNEFKEDFDKHRKEQGPKFTQILQSLEEMGKIVNQEAVKGLVKISSQYTEVLSSLSSDAHAARLNARYSSLWLDGASYSFNGIKPPSSIPRLPSDVVQANVDHPDNDLLRGGTA